MTMAQFVSGRFLQNITQAGRTIAVWIVNETTAWSRPANMPANQVKDQFVAKVRNNMKDLRTDTVKVAMKYVKFLLIRKIVTDKRIREGVHVSESDQAPHFTLYEFDKANNITKTSHVHVIDDDENEGP